jgi:Mlc titration factor MtfA (ptsG expression regulator)
VVLAWPPRAILFRRVAAAAIAVVVSLGAAAVGGPPWALLGLVAGGLYYGATTQRYRTRRRLLAEPFPDEHRAILRQRVAYYRAVDGDAARRFEDDVRIFLSEQVITGAGDHEVDETTRVLVAASAAIITNGIPDWEWPRMRDIVVYPRSFGDDYHVDSDGPIAGQVGLQGPMILSERDLKLGFRRQEGHNVGLHELAHVVDMLDGHADGVPADAEFAASAPWVTVVAERLAALRRGKKSPLRDYAAINEAELFAVAVEVFFEKPGDLAERDPELFELMADYFNQDPRRPGEAVDG